MTWRRPRPTKTATKMDGIDMYKFFGAVVSWLQTT